MAAAAFDSAKWRFWPGRREGGVRSGSLLFFRIPNWQRMSAFNETSAANAFQKKKREGGSSGEWVPAAGPSPRDFRERMLAVEWGLARSHDAEGSSSLAAVNRATVRDAPKDYEYLCDLCTRKERLRAQKSENPRFRNILAENDAVEISGSGGGGDPIVAERDALWENNDLSPAPIGSRRSGSERTSWRTKSIQFVSQIIAAVELRVESHSRTWNRGAV